LGDSSVDSPDQTFSLLWKKAIEEYEIINYAGHSGLGGNLDIESINDNLRGAGREPIRFKKNPYQIYFFNGCSTYAYFNRKYFRAKGGTAYMESITTGLPSYFGDGVDNTMAFVGPFLSFTKISYPSIIKEIEKTNQTWGSTLLFVNGDQDNPTSL
jgi:hypothetical protein